MLGVEQEACTLRSPDSPHPGTLKVTAVPLPSAALSLLTSAQHSLCLS